ncbi:ryanodine receptor [Lingula anatina]|uniref:Ryanodine receptor n=1 Tax=Lingula anatina TaxID=7574 RepID=A0A1S3I400_LINAN|nr:ryanodine receptor [Lingula anatina]|eukprot:XP_013392084.1 ryanodine receptor [Lingula anatina]
MFQFELGRTKTTLPLSAALFRGAKDLIPQCPSRLDVQLLVPHRWSSVPNKSLKVNTLKLSEIRGWSMLCESPVAMLGLHIPEEDRSLDILELIEHTEALKFHVHTLELYRAICSHGNHRAAYELTKHVDERQLMYCIQSEYLSGALRMGFHDLLISMHLESHAVTRLMTQNEFIIPLVADPKPLYQFVDKDKEKERQSIPKLERSVSIRPHLQLEGESNVGSMNLGVPEGVTPPAPMAAPPFYLGALKEHTMHSLVMAVKTGGPHIRDPIGGSQENLFVPLLRLIDRLLVMGMCTEEDLHQLFVLIDPHTFDKERSFCAEGLLQMKLAEPVKLEMCHLLKHLCDCQLRKRMESIMSFATDFCAAVQNDQRVRYNYIKQSDLPPAIAAKKTREFRCTPQEQMRSLLNFKSEEDEDGGMVCPCSDDLKEILKNFHNELLEHCAVPSSKEEKETEVEAVEPPPASSWQDKILQLVAKKREEKKAETDEGKKQGEKPDEILGWSGSLQNLISNTMRKWAEEDFITDQSLVQEMFSLLYRQYDGIGEVLRAILKTYVISAASTHDINNLVKALGNIRALLNVQVAPQEEETLKSSIKDLLDNKVFFQHPDLMRALYVHETVMQLMVNTLNKQQQQQAAGGGEVKRDGDVEQPVDNSTDMVVMCCRFLCYFCRTSRQNQRAMFDHLSYLLENSSMLLAHPSLRGSCPLDVAYSSMMDNNELALALRESHLEKVAVYLSRAGVQSNSELLAKGYPDIGWDPVEGERFLDFLRFCVWVNGESVEENSNLVVRLLIRRPECLGPALRGEGGGLLKAMKDGIRMSEQIAASRDSMSSGFLAAINDDNDTEFLRQSEEKNRHIFLTHDGVKYDFSTLPPEDDEDYIDMGGAILDFYSALVDLLGRCAPDAEIIKSGRSDSLRARAILRSLVSVEDLEGVLGLKFILPITSQSDDGEAKQSEGSLPPGLLPQHKSAVVQFLERVYGIPDQSTFFRLLEDGFLPDLRAATTLDTAAASDSDMALALNRYLCNSVLPLLTAYAHFFDDADHVSSLLDSTLHTTYRLSKCRSLTKNQKDLVTEFLVSLTGHLRPPMMTKLLRKLTIDLPGLNENTVVPLRVLTHHYERCGRYYGTGGWGSWGAATEEEKKLTMMLFTLIFDSLAQRAYDPELFSKALPCLSAIGCALSPDYSLSNQDEPWLKDASLDTDGMYNPQPVETTRISLSSPLESVARKFAEHYHDSWAVKKFDQSWVYGPAYDEDNKIHPNLKPFSMLNNKDSVRCLEPVRESMRAMLAWGWTLDVDQNRLTSGGSLKRRGSRVSVDSQNYNPRPVDLRNLTLTREMQNMAERLASNSHDVWARKKKDELDAIGGGIHQQVVPFDILTDKEKRPHRERAQELLKFLQMQGYRLQSNDMADNRKMSVAGPRTVSNSRQSKDSEADSGVGVSATEKRFAYSLLEKLLEYVDKAAVNLNTLKPSSRYSRRESYTMATEDVKFFGKVVLPLVEKYFRAHKVYFIAAPGMPQASVGMASVKEKEMTASLFCKLAYLLRQKITAFGHDVDIAVRCLQVLVHAIDARSVVKNSPEIVRSSLLPFFNNAADDLYQVVHNIKSGRFSHVKGTISRGATSLNYVHMVLLPVLSSMFDHLGSNNYGADLLVGEMQLASYKILNALYTLGTSTAACVERIYLLEEMNRHRPLLGECIASFASTFPVAFLEPQLNRYNKHSMLYGITEERIAEHSLEAQDVMKQLADNLPTLDKIVAEIEELAESGGKYQEAPHVIEVTLPMLCSYLPFWWSQGPDNVNLTEGQDYGSDRRNSLQFDTSSSNHVTTVTAQLMNAVLGNVLKLIKNNVGTPNAPWMNRIATRTQPIIANSTLEMLEEHMLPLAEKITDNRHKVELLEEQYNAIKRNQQDIDSEIEEQLHDAMHILVRDIYAFFPLLIKYVDQHRSHWLRNPTVGAEKLYTCIAEIFTYWTKSPFFKREEHNFVTQNEIDNMALIMPSQQGKSLQVVRADSGNQSQDQESTVPKSGRKKHKPKMDSYTSLNVACLKRLLPIGLNLFGGREQELVQQAKDKLIQKEPEGDIEEFLKSSLMLEDENEENDNKWQKVLYKKIGRTKFAGVVEMTLDHAVERVMSMARVLHGLHLVEHPPPSHKGAWRKVISTQRKRAVMACFRMVPLHNLPRHRVINLFMKAYKEQWLIMEDIGQVRLIEDLTHSEEEDIEKKEEEEEEKPDALTQLVTALSRTATTEQDTLQENFLYMSFAQIMSKSCSGEDEDDDDENEEDPGASFQEQEMEKQQLLFEQSRLADRAAAEMMLLYISASRGAWTDMVINTIDLGISLLRGGNEEIQSRMLTHLREKKDVGFFTSIAGMMQRCSVLDLDAFERNNKAESLGVGSEGAAGVKNLHDAEQTCKLFRFLQLLCEGHNLEFQNYLRTQAGNNTTVNIIICTVDYLLRLQESIMDFYWHYSGKDVIDPAGKDNFVRAIKVAKQVFRTLTEYIQGPCSQNQLALAHSRLWDAVGGFLYIFAHMQDKLSKDPEQLELLREFMKLQKDMMIMLLSMLEGNVMNGPIGKQMVDTLVESSANVEMILKFFDIFLKMKDMTTSEAFLEFDTNKDGWISCKEFRRAMLDQKMYKSEEIDYIMMCVDTNQDGKVDFMEFTDRFHNPAKDIGFNVAVLLTNLSEHMPSEPRLARLMERAKPVLDYFGMYLGRIEILGSSGRIERVYFEIKQSHIDQWEKPQIKESKRSFLHSVVNEGGDKEKLESFVNFCEDTIFEMQHATSISAEEQMAQMATAAALRKEAGLPEEQGAVAINAVKTGFSMLKDGILLFLSFFSWANIKHGYQTVKGMTFSEMLLALMKLGAKAVLAIMTLMFHIVWMLGKWVIAMMMGDQGGDLPSKDVSHKALPYASPLALEGEKARPGPGKQLGREAEMAGEDPEQYRVFGLDIHREETDVGVEYSLSASQRHLAQTTPESSLDMSEGEMADHLQPKQNGIHAGEPAYGGTHGDQYDAFHQKKPPHDAPAGGEHASGEDVTDKRKQAKDDELPYEIKGTEYGNFVLGWFARNFYNFKFAALVLAFIINFVLLFYQVVKVPIAGEDVGNDMAEAAVNATEGEEGGEEPSEEEFEEWITMASTLYYLLPVVQLCALAHTIVSFSIAIAYYCLKVPLVIFKREKEIARKLEFEGMWIAEQPSEDDIKSHWDKLVLSTASFPESYWDKFVKKKVRNKYCEQFDFDEISNLLGMEKGSTIPGKDAHQEQPKSRFLPHFLQGVDWQYHIWKWGVIFTDNSFLYLLCFCLFSVLGNFNYFFFAAHLLDLAIGIKALSTILQSVTHNGKQLVLTVMLTIVVVYVYTVIAFNFFRQFYAKEEDGEKDYKCQDMLTCFIFHLYVGVRAGGGIGDEIEAPDGDPYEVYRILFDITFFFFVIVILLAIMQGLIIDAFGELRDQLEQVKEDMESKCFICGIGKEYFDKVPHGFEQHVMNEHNFANYMFFLMHLINKPDTEYTGQESYVWELYNQRCWDFFPVGDCFRKQYEDEPQGS